MAAMRDDTPYHHRPLAEVRREQACMRQIFRQAPDVSYIWEAFAGVGVTAEVLRKRFPLACLQATDLDAECVARYNDKDLGTAFQMDALQWSHQHLPAPARSWGISLDYNKFTIYDLRGRGQRWKMQLLQASIAAEPAWLQMTDSACRYLHLNWHRYGLAKDDFDLYLDALCVEFRTQPGGNRYHLRSWDKHHAASYLLFVRS